MSTLESFLGPEIAAHSLPVFAAQRHPDDLDLVQAVHTKLVQAGLGLQAQQFFVTDRDIRSVANASSQGQRHVLNQYWNFQLLQFGASTQNARFHLVNEGTAQEWLGLFEQVVLPVLIELKLPSALQ